MEGIKLNTDILRGKKCKLAGNPKVGWLCNKNGLLLKTYRWLVDNAAGIVLLIHGFQGDTQLTFMRKKVKIMYANEGIIVCDNGYIFKDSWIERFNRNGYSVYGLDLQGHGESQSLGNIRNDVNCFDDLVDDVIQYLNQIQDEISNDNQTNDDILIGDKTDDESYDIVPTKKKRLPMYIIGHSMGGNIALRILQLLGKAKEDRIKDANSNNYKNCNTILDNSTNINEIDNDMYDMNNFNDYDYENSGASTSATINAIISANGKHEGCYNYLDKLNIKGCVSLAGMIRIKTPLDSGNKSFKYFYLPIINFASRIAPDARLLVKFRSCKSPKFSVNICKNNEFVNKNGIKLKCVYELIKATVTLDSNINYMPKDIPFLIVHSKDDGVCSYEWASSFYNKANVIKKELHSVDDMDHIITTNPGYEDILKKVINWISDLRMNDEDE
ncbi:lysophospholipase, putative [Plasmodium vinckei brucechwatti]|uniref:Lysophospholipase, putative n=1 Tax=Plasmodium vinckei brucechwatti TaxID=119398 RepID=A0A6V7S899_PLAVN|nr:lysophospholipase, putative [Plasmodium vinckei brucechwatti]